VQNKYILLMGKYTPVSPYSRQC